MVLVRARARAHTHTYIYIYTFEIFALLIYINLRIVNYFAGFIIYDFFKINNILKYRNLFGHFNLLLSQVCEFHIKDLFGYRLLLKTENIIAK